MPTAEAARELEELNYFAFQRGISPAAPGVMASISEEHGDPGNLPEEAPVNCAWNKPTPTSSVSSYAVSVRSSARNSSKGSSSLKTRSPKDDNRLAGVASSIIGGLGGTEGSHGKGNSQKVSECQAICIYIQFNCGQVDLDRSLFNGRFE